MNNFPIFIGGQMKSGTTLLRMLLGRHSNLYSGLETFWFKDEISIDYSKNTKDIIKIKEFYDLNDIEFLYIIELTKSNKKHVIDNLFKYICKKENKNRWIEKTPDNILYINLITKYWNDQFQFIHVIRDYRDIYASWKNSNKYNIDIFINNVKKSYKLFLPYKNNKNILEVKYENIILHTENTIFNILDFLDETFENTCIQLDIENSKKEFEKVKKITNKESATLISTQQPIFPSKIGQYKRILTRDEIYKIESELDFLFKIYEYSI
jgi:protein-tyrosine sulfotransferase